MYHQHPCSSVLSSALMAQVEFDEAKGEIPEEFLHVEYKLFREDLRALMGKPPDKLPARAADDERWALW